MRCMRAIHIRPHGVPKRRPGLEVRRKSFSCGGHTRQIARGALLSFERPAGESLRLRPRRTLKTAQLAKQRKITVVTGVGPKVQRRPSTITVKIVRAHGGCLGIRSRRRAWTAAISRGEVLNRLRPADSRMGKPGTGNAVSSRAEYIGA